MLNIIEEMLIVLVWRLGGGGGGGGGGVKGSGVSIAGQIILEENIWWSQLAGYHHIHTYMPMSDSSPRPLVEWARYIVNFNQDKPINSFQEWCGINGSKIHIIIHMTNKGKTLKKTYFKSV